MTVYKHFDGPLYVVVAKSFYDPNKIKALKLEIPVSKEYFAAHLPGYPALIKLVDSLLPLGSLGYLKSMIIVNLLATVGLVLLFYFILKRFRLTGRPLILATVLLFLPRFLVVRSVGAPESLFMLFILCSLFFFEKERYWLSGLFGALATVTKTPGLLLFAAYGLVFIEKTVAAGRYGLVKTFSRLNVFKMLGILLIPFGLVVVFFLYFIRTGDFFAYFHSGDNIHLLYPFAVFDFKNTWVGTGWLEDVIFYFFLYGLATVALFKSKHRSFFYFTLVFYTAILFVQHRDIARYSLPLWPMATVAFEKFFTSKKFLIVFLLLLPAIYLYAWNFLDYNVMPISNWKSFL